MPRGRLSKRPRCAARCCWLERPALHDTAQCDIIMILCGCRVTQRGRTLDGAWQAGDADAMFRMLDDLGGVQLDLPVLEHG